MTIMESESFVYNNIDSKTLSIANVNFETGLLEEPFLAEREFIETQIRGRDRPYFIEVRKKPISINLNFAFTEPWNKTKLRNVLVWLNQDTYKELYFSANTNRRFFAMYIDAPKLLHNALSEGYVQIKMRTNCSHAFGPEVVSDIYDYSDNDEYENEIIFNNTGDLILKPEIQIEKIGEGDVSIINEADDDREFKFIDLEDKEIIYVDNYNEYIKTNIPNTYRYDNFNNNYLKLLVGENNLVIYGDCKIQFRYRLNYL